MDKKQIEFRSYNVEDERRFRDLAARIKALEQWMDDSKDRPDSCTEADLRFLERSNSDVWPRIAALEARCHELEHSRAAGVQSQIADLQERVTNTQELLLQTVARLDAADAAWAATRKRQMDALRKECGVEVDDQRDKERPKEPGPVIRYVRKQATPVKPEMMACPGDGTEDCASCEYHKPHPCDDDCSRTCCLTGKCYRCQPVPAQETEKPAPELVRCEDYQHCIAVCSSAAGDHRSPHQRRPQCGQQCGHGKARCIPVAASPEVAIPDVPTPVGTEAFRRELRRHAEELSQGYGYQGRMDAALMGIDEPWEHLAGVACTLRDAYELARTGEHEAAQEKLKEIEW